MQKNTCLLAACLLYTLAAFAQKKVEAPYPITKQLIADKAIVVSAHPLATAVGVSVLRQGGNAVDAAIATQFALAVVYPRAGNIGGGGFMLLRAAKSKIEALDYRETAPKAAYKTMYLDGKQQVIANLSTTGGLASGTPGSVAGMWAAHQKYGKLAWRKLVEPAIKLARNGIQLTAGEAKTMSNYAGDFAKAQTLPSAFTAKKVWHEGDILVQKDLATVLKNIQQHGRDGFYKGATAEKIVAEMQRNKGAITLDDLASYEAKWREPLVGTYKNYTVIGMPPPSSGGVFLLQILKMLEHYPRFAATGWHSADAIHLIVECERRAYADRAEHLGDPDFWHVPLKTLLDSAYIAKRIASIILQKATPSSTQKAGSIAESEQTTHLCVVDAKGNAVSITTTLNDNFGSKVVVGNAGFFLNNEMDDFSVKTGVPNMYGLVGNEANAIAPLKRPLSSMTPTIFLKDQKPFLVIGTPGGGTIITSVLQTFLNVAEYGMPLKEAVHAKRFHHQWLPDQIYLEEDAIPLGTMQRLEAMGHKLETRSPIGRVEAILFGADGKLEGVADNRGDDDAGGF